jgi:hypothetical protein
VRLQLPRWSLLGPTCPLGRRLGQCTQLLTKLRELRHPFILQWHLPAVVITEQMCRTTKPYENPSVASTAAFPAVPRRLWRRSRRVEKIAGYQVHA